MPRLTEAHCHLDKCHTFPRLEPDGVTLADAIAAHEADMANCTAADIRARAERGLRELHAAGCVAVRTHVDWTVDREKPERTPLAWNVLGELAQEWRGRIALQRAALFSIDDFVDEATAKTLARRVARDGGVLGAFVLDHPDRPGKIANMVAAARSHDLMLDLHIDEESRIDHGGLDLVADALIATAFERPVLCGHGCGLATLSGEVLARRIEKIAKASITVAVLPTTNLYLQHRDPGGGTPERRGLTRVNELAKGGVDIVFGSDNADDAFCPTGFHDPLHALSLGVLAAHLNPPLAAWLPTITGNAARAIESGIVAIDGISASQLLMTEARTTSELLSLGSRRLDALQVFHER
jgi:cytosine deaminase